MVLFSIIDLLLYQYICTYSNTELMTFCFYSEIKLLKINYPMLKALQTTRLLHLCWSPYVHSRARYTRKNACQPMIHGCFDFTHFSGLSLTMGVSSQACSVNAKLKRFEHTRSNAFLYSRQASQQQYGRENSEMTTFTRLLT